MGAPEIVYLGQEVRPGESVEISVDIAAPQKPGVYQGNWKLQNTEGQLFGIGPNSSAPFWVRIMVLAPPTDTDAPATQTPTLTETLTLIPSLTPSPTLTETAPVTPSITPGETDTLTPVAPTTPAPTLEETATLTPTATPEPVSWLPLAELIHR
jgi:hypothetical protein